MLDFDDMESQRVEATYQTPDVVEQRRLSLDLLALAPGERVLDVGSGPGILAAEMAERVGEQGAVHGVDPSESMLAIAQRRAAPNVTFSIGEAIPLDFDDATFDAATATQVYEYVPDIAGALAEAHRVLRPGGRLLILDTDWDSIVWRSNDDERMRRVLAAWDEHLAHAHLPRYLGSLLRDAGFRVTRLQVIPLVNVGYTPDIFSHYLIGFVSSFVPGHQGVTEDDIRAWADDLAGLGDDYFFSLNRYVYVAEK